jgi:hypothetical protein
MSKVPVFFGHRYRTWRQTGVLTLMPGWTIWLAIAVVGFWTVIWWLSR